MGHVQMNVRTRACSRTFIVGRKQADLTHNIRGKELRGPKGLTRWVDLSSHQYPENGLLAGLRWGFHPKITL